MPTDDRGGAIVLVPVLRSRAWSLAVVLLAALLVVLLTAYAGTARSIVRVWLESATYTHGLLVAPVSAWLIWRRRACLRVLDPQVTWSALVLVAGLVAIWLLAAAGNVAVLRHLALVAPVPSVLLVLLGPVVIARIAFPLAFLVFAVPWGEGLVPLLQDGTATFTVMMAHIAGVPIARDGWYLAIPGARFVVAETCSGLRYLLPALALGSLYAWMTYRSPRRRAGFMAAAVAVPLLANGLRASFVVILAYYGSPALAIGMDHMLYGWVFFGVVVLVLFWGGSRWREAPASSGANTPTAGTSASPAEPVRPRAGRFALAASAVAAVLVAGPLLQMWVERSAATVATAVHLPAAADWRYAPAERSVLEPVFVGASLTAVGEYRAVTAGAAVELLVIHYRHERQGAELVNAGNHLYGGGWRTVARQLRDVPTRGTDPELNERLLRRGGERRLAWSWYQIGDWRTTRGWVAKALGAVRRVLGRGGDASLVVLSTAVEDGSPAPARERLRTFLEAHPAVALPGGMIRHRAVPAERPGTASAPADVYHIRSSGTGKSA